MTINFVTRSLRTSSYHNTIWVIVDRLTKSTQFLIVKTTDSVSKLVRFYVEEIVRLHGVVIFVVSGRDPYFTSKFWGSF